MISKASNRGGAISLGQHLLKTENEHVELHDVRGFIADDVMGAFKEAQAMASGTQCKKFLFSVSLNPAHSETVRVEVFEHVAHAIEERLGLQGQPRVIIFHVKQGRRHAHAVWSRIDAETLTARKLDFFKTKLNALSRELFLENGWPMPKGFKNPNLRDPTSFTLEEWQQAKRVRIDPRELKSAVQECWKRSDSATALANALEVYRFFFAGGVAVAAGATAALLRTTAIVRVDAFMRVIISLVTSMLGEAYVAMAESNNKFAPRWATTAFTMGSRAV
jgi:hypothetical protein